jgi:N-acetylglutamate synthase-like GNAT family acetyltransferase
MVYFRINEYLDSKIEAEAQRLGITKVGFISLLVQNYFDDITFERRRVSDSPEEVSGEQENKVRL